ncbi:MAG TPA: histidinol-phosphate transaminase [Candidatus Acidoferrales bacterium]|nr:histidinol-phosphate transaminase [Candidatus Acidoferrales bacterium]
MKRSVKHAVMPRRALSEGRDRPPMLENRAGKLRLDMNENLLGCSPKVRAALQQLDEQMLAMYPEKETAIARLAPLFGVHADEMLVAGGIDETLRLIADVYIERGRCVLLVEPTFPMYRFYSEQRDARIRTVCYDREMRFPMREVLRELKTTPSIFFLANPNNPTGSLLDARALGKILDAARRTLVVIDEAYVEFSGVTVLPQIRRRRNLAVTRTFSKATGLAGLRVGCIFAHRDVARVLKRAQAPFPIGAAALVAAEAALEDRAFVGHAVQRIRRGRATLERGLRRLGVQVFPSAANFVLVDFGGRGPAIVAALERRGILVRDQAASFARPGFVRITVGTAKQMQTCLRTLEMLL